MVVKMIGGAAAALLLGSTVLAQSYTERPVTPKLVNEAANYDRRSVDIPMRDGVKLHTVILTPRGFGEWVTLLENK